MKSELVRFIAVTSNEVVKRRIETMFSAWGHVDHYENFAVMHAVLRGTLQAGFEKELADETALIAVDLENDELTAHRVHDFIKEHRQSLEDTVFCVIFSEEQRTMADSLGKYAGDEIDIIMHAQEDSDYRRLWITTIKVVEKKKKRGKWAMIVIALGIAAYCAVLWLGS